MKKYQVIYCDPPWSYGRAMSSGSAAKNHYPTMSLSQLAALPVSELADDDCLMFMWATGPKLAEALTVLQAWGFKYVTIGFVWEKQRPCVGHYTMSSVELCLIGKRGKIPKPRGATNVRQFLSKRLTKHSAKPPEIAQAIASMFPTQARIELFCRTPQDGWDVWGNEVEPDAAADAILNAPQVAN